MKATDTIEGIELLRRHENLPESNSWSYII